jgi:hypothetical protein
VDRGRDSEAILKPHLISMKGVKKQNLPSKICLRCQRPFVWRKKWARDWENVRYCSDACRRGKVL